MTTYITKVMLQLIDSTKPRQLCCMRNMVGICLYGKLFMPQEVTPFKTIEEQITILEKRGLIIDDKEVAKKFLQGIL